MLALDFKFCESNQNKMLHKMTRKRSSDTTPQLHVLITTLHYPPAARQSRCVRLPKSKMSAREHLCKMTRYNGAKMSMMLRTEARWAVTKMFCARKTLELDAMTRQTRK